MEYFTYKYFKQIAHLCGLVLSALNELNSHLSLKFCVFVCDSHPAKLMIFKKVNNRIYSVCLREEDRTQDERGKPPTSSYQTMLIACGFSGFFSFLQQLYAAQLASMQISPGAKMAPLPQAPNSSSPLSPSTLKSEKQAASPVAQIKVSSFLNSFVKL